MSIFVGRDNEQGWFNQWLTDEPQAPEERAALLIGPAGLGKSALLRRYERICLDHHQPRCYVQRIDLNANESAAQFFERLIHDARRLLKKSRCEADRTTASCCGPCSRAFRARARCWPP